MSEPSSYVIETLSEDEEYVLCRHVSDREPSPHLALTPIAARPTPESVARLEHAYALRNELDSAWAARPVALEQHEGRPTLFVEDPGGEVLAQLVGKPWDLAVFLHVAIGMTVSLGQLHARGLIHKDIKPANFLVNRAAGKAWLTGFGIASHLPRERQSPEPPEFIVGTLAYMAPEQTGRMNRSIDSRSDLYSLGVTLYEMLTGALPFTATEPMEWVHCHIARQPTPANARVKGIPDAVAAIVMKLLAKTAEERYQTAAGLESDLRYCLAEWERLRRIDEFPLGQHDVPDRLLIPEKLYGREREIDTLLASFDRVVASGRPELVLVSGYSGIGKSSVVNELHKVLVPPRGLFASGKFDQYKRDIPYATLAQAFQSLVRQLLSKDDAELSRWRESLLEALGPNGQLMVNLIPELALIIGEQPAVPDVPPQDAQNRFQRVLRRFLGVFARPEHPLALFLDDLQWLDTATLELIEDLLTQPEVRHLMLIGAYRDNEVNASHPLTRTLDACRRAGVNLHHIVLAPLGFDDLSQLIADTLRCNRERVQPLVKLIEDKSGGNPFFAIQFITALVEDGLVAFDRDAAAWQWDMGRIHAKRVSDNVAELMAGKLNRLPSATLEALKQLACLGNRARTAALGIILGISQEEVHATLWEAVRAGLIFRLERGYVFLHDRVQEAAYALIPDAERARMHVRIGRLLASQTAAQEQEEKVFDIVNQFNRGAELLISAAEREHVGELNLLAGKRAKASTAYASALTYFTAGGAMLAEDSWERQYRLTFDLECHRAECEFLTGELATAEARLSALAERAADLLDKAAVTRLRVVLYMMLGRFDLAVEVAREYLRDVGIEWPRHPTEADVRQECQRMWQLLNRQPIDQLLDLPVMSNPEWRATMDVFMDLVPSAVLTDNNLLDLILVRMVNLSLEHGHCDASCYAYACLNVVLGGRSGDYQAALRFGQLACDLVEKRGLDRFKARVYTSFGALVIPWTKYLPTSRALMRRAIDAANATGDMTFAVYSSQMLTTNLLISGEPLGDVQREAEHGLAFARKVGFSLFVDCFIGQLMLIRTLRGIEPEVASLDEAGHGDGWFERHLEENPHLALAACWYWIDKLQARFFLQDYAAGMVAAAKAENLLWSTRALVEGAEYHFYSALTRAAACDSAPVDQRSQYLEALYSHHQQIAVWAENCPENFANRAALVSAEIARIEGRALDAMDLYERAIRSAEANGFVHNEALANELAARFYAARGFKTIADVYLRNARSCYLRWGADGKVRQLDQMNPHLRDEAAAPRSTTAIGTPVAHLDLATVVKVSQAISSEIDLKKLVDTLMVTTLEHAGAERGFLILPHGNELRIEAEANISRDMVEVRLRQARVTSSELPESILQYVIRSQGSVILDDAAVSSPFSTDDYVRQRRSRAILCLPLVKQSKLIGVLYLENNLTSHVFTPARTAVLELLASQAAISLENARLYDDLQQENSVRRRVEEELRRSEAYLAEAQRFSHTGSFGWNVATGEMFWSEETYRIAGYDRAFKPTFEQVFPRVHPEDVVRVRETLDRGIQNGTDLDLELRYLMADGSVKYFHVVAHAVRDESDNLEYVGSVMDITEQHDAKTALERALAEIEKSEDQLRIIIDTIPTLAWCALPDGSTEFLNQRWLDYTGLAAQEAQGWGWRATIHPEDLTNLEEKWRTVLASGAPGEAEARMRRFDGEYRWFLFRTVPLRDELGNIVRWYGTNTDIEDRKRAEEALRSRAQSSRLIIDSIPGLVCTMTAAGELELVNRQILEYFGKTFEDLKDWAMSDAVHPRDIPRVIAAWRHSIETGQPYDIEHRIRRADGIYRWFHVRALPQRDTEGRVVRWHVLLTDVDDRKKAEEKLRRSEESLLDAQRLSRTGSWTHDFLSGTVTTSPETLRMWGIESGDDATVTDFFFARMHPEDRFRVEEAYREAQLKKADFESEFRIVLPDGSIRNIHSIGRPIVSESGDILEFVGAAIDITERKRAEQRMMLQHAVTQMLAEAAALEEVAPKILQTVCEFLLWEVGVFWRVDAEAGVLRCVEVWHRESVKVPQFEAICRQSTFIPGIGLPGRLWSSHAPAYIPDVVNDANFPRASVASSEGLHAAFGFPIMLGGDVVGVMEFFVREIRQSEQELLSMMATLGSQIGQFIDGKRAEEKLHKAQAELAHVTRVTTMGELTASIAHEVNQPLTAVLANANASLRWLGAATPNLDEVREAVGRIIRDGNRASDVIRRIRALVKKGETEKTPLETNEVIEEVVSLAHSEIQKAGVVLKLDLAHDLPPILGDRIQLQQVILNLVMNGIEAMNSVTDRQREMLIRSSSHESDAVVIAVQDSGIGVDAHHLDKIFDTFYTTKSQGMGMGLAISRSIIENHGGRLWAVPNDGPGATFQFTLLKYR